jgi:putative ABC transport system substrate-binding protein
MRRREFIAGIGGAVALVAVARAQQSDRMRRIGVLMPYDENDAEIQGWLSGFTQGLAALGWTDGRTVRMDIRWAAGNLDRMPMFAKELVDLQPDVILAVATLATDALHHETRTIPIVFALVADPIGAGFVASLTRPGGNITGFSNMEPTMGSKWLELLTEIAPGIKRAAIMFNPDAAPYSSYFLPSFQAAARSHNLEQIAATVHSDAEIKTVITSLGREPRGGLVVMPDVFTEVHRSQINSLAAQNNVPTVYGHPSYPRVGGLISYGTDTAEEFRRAAPYVDRILRGAKPADLPVQLPVKFEMALNAKTAKALGLTVPPSILLRADEIIE